MPTGHPPLLAPSLQKQDITRIKKEISRYNEAGVFSPEAKEKWDRLLGNFSTKYGSLPEQSPEWILNSFQPTSIRDAGTNQLKSSYLKRLENTWILQNPFERLGLLNMSLK